MNNNFKDMDHALQTGMVIGHLQQCGVLAYPIHDSDGDYLPRIVLRGQPFGKAIIEVLPEVKEG